MASVVVGSVITPAQAQLPGLKAGIPYRVTVTFSDLAYPELTTLILGKKADNGVPMVFSDFVVWDQLALEGGNTYSKAKNSLGRFNGQMSSGGDGVGLTPGDNYYLAVWLGLTPAPSDVPAFKAGPYTVAA